MRSLKIYSSIRIWALISKHCTAVFVEDRKTYNVQLLAVWQTDLWGEIGWGRYCSWSDAKCYIFYSSIIYLSKNPKSLSSLRAGPPLLTSASLALGLRPHSAELGPKECCSGRLWLHDSGYTWQKDQRQPSSYHPFPSGKVHLSVLRIFFFKMLMLPVKMPFPCWIY